MARIIVTDPLAEEGLALLREAGHDVQSFDDQAAAHAAGAVADAEAWIVRSGTNLSKDDYDAAPQLKAVGRAGVGVDNVNLPEATAHGVAVFHAPTGNITSAAEQAWALMLAAARRVPEADAAMKNEDWARKRLKGVELAGKTLFIVGLGRIGRMMAARAQAFEMKTIGFDPFVTKEAAAGFGVERVELDEGFERADIITLHTPLTPQTRDLVGTDALARCKKGVIIVNAARGGLIDAEALHAALEAGAVHAAGIDVWPEEPPADWSLAKHPRVVAAPHLGASTKEAQLKAATQACERVRDFLATGDAGLAVNAQATVSDTLRPWVDLVERLAAFGIQALPASLEQITVCAPGSLDAKALQVHALVGALRASTDEPVNAISAPGLAKERGWTVATRELPDDDRFLRIEFTTAKGRMALEGTHTPHYGGRVTELDGYSVEFRPRGRFLFTRHQDVPGVLASLTALLAEAKVNVASVSLARRGEDGTAVAVIQVDGSIPVAARDGLRRLDAITEAHRIRVDD